MDQRVIPDSGFSLMELMIVVAILSILSLGAMLSVGARGADRISDVTRFRGQYQDMRDQAVLSRQVLSLTLGAQGMQRWAYNGADWVADGPAIALRGHQQARPGYGAEVTGTGDLRIVALPDGRSSAFAVELEDGATSWRCDTDGWGELICDPIR